MMFLMTVNQNHIFLNKLNTLDNYYTKEKGVWERANSYLAKKLETLDTYTMLLLATGKKCNQGIRVIELYFILLK